MSESPVLTFSLYLAVLSLAAALAAVLGGSDLLDRPASSLLRLRPWIRREQDLAASLGWSGRTWMLVRGGTVLAVLLPALLTRIPLAIAAGPVASFLAVPYLLSGRAAARRLRRERALVDWVRTIISRMRRNQGIDVVLRDSGLHPPLGLEAILQPLADPALLMDVALVRMAERARMPEAEMVVLALLASRTRRQEDLVRLLDHVVLPVMEAKLAEQTDALEAVTQKRSQAIAMSLIMLGMFLALVRVDPIRRGFATLGGQLLLVAIAAAFALVLLLVSRLYHAPRETRWDLDRYRGELRGIGSV